MDEIRQAAVGRRKTWQGHDERNQELCAEGAYELFDALTDAEDEDLYHAGEMVKDAFWMADIAEEYQEEENTYDENRMYARSTRLLKEARDRVGLNPRPMTYRGSGWWKQYRRENKMGALTFVALEHFSEIGWRKTYDSTKLLLEASTGHDTDDWDSVDEKLEEYYELVLPRMKTQSV